MQLPLDGTSLAVLVAASTAAYVGAAYWLYRDAAARGSERPLSWVTNWALFNVAAIGYYLLVRGRIGERSSPLSAGEHLAGTVALGAGLAFVLATAAAPPDPITQGRVFAAALVATLPLAYGLRVAARWLQSAPGQPDE